LAAKGQLRHQIWGVVYWLQSQLNRQQVDVRYHCYAEVDEVLAEQPELVIIATGGMPEPLAIDGGKYALSSWDVLAGEKCKGQVLLFDDHGDHQGAVAAEVLATNGAEVFYLTPDRTSLMELGPTNSAVVLRNLYRQGVQFEVNQDLIAIEKQHGKKLARLRHTLTGELSERIVDHIVVERGVSPLVDVYEALKPVSRNAGAVDINALISGQLCFPEVNAEGQFDLVRIGDAVSSRNLHAAIYDALRIASLYKKQN
ncbi:MAG: N-methylproline demethylase, partial [Gammaproteobacteria bacterium]|nr:N-methylproline demethylase [Gammaproteobacteria bacterium]